MSRFSRTALNSTALFFLAATAMACTDQAQLPVAAGTGPNPELPEPDPEWIPTVNTAEATGWERGQSPVAADGMTVQAFAQDLDHPRWLYVLPNGDVLVAETNAPERPEHDDGIRAWVMGMIMADAGAAVPSADRIALLRDDDGDGIADQRTIFLENLNSPFGMALVGNDFYVANTDAIVRFPYEEGATRIDADGAHVTDLPAGPFNHHWTKNIIASPDGSKLYATVGSNSNVAEHGMEMEEGRAAIWEVDIPSGEKRLFATGLRNPNGLDWEPVTGMLWTAVNERDEIGSDLVPDYMTSVRGGGFYGWPYSYYGDNVDERVEPQRPDLVERTIVPDYALGAHTASLGLAFAETGSLPPRFSYGAFVGQHGSWNRDPPSGYRVIFVPFANGKPSGDPEEVLTGFREGDESYGRPVDVAFADNGSLLVADDVGNTIWRVSGNNSFVEAR